MRQWMVDPKMLCRKHLLGEHVEHHMFIGTIMHGISIKGYISKGLLDPPTLYARHEALVEEMISRGYNHKSPLKEIILPTINGNIDTEANIVDLQNRCTECKKLIENFKNKTI